MQHPVGEAWEFSVDPDQESRSADNTHSLRELIQAAPVQWLGKRIGEAAGMTSIQLKLIDAADPLSLQVHPPWRHPRLHARESGKFETWVILDAEQGAGVYLGLREGVTDRQLRAAIETGTDVHKLLNFVPVQAGDIFHVEGGTPHAIGAGVLLLEPQAVQPNRQPATYRFWDWQRRYNAAGQRDGAGQERVLDVDASFDVIRWNGSRGERFVAESRGEAETIVLFSGGKVEVLAQNEWFRLERIVGTGKVSIPPLDSIAAVLCLRGSADLQSEAGDLHLAHGRSAALPAACGRVDFELHDQAIVYVLREISDWVV